MTVYIQGRLPAPAFSLPTRLFVCLSVFIFQFCTPAPKKETALIHDFVHLWIIYPACKYYLIHVL